MHRELTNRLRTCNKDSQPAKPTPPLRFRTGQRINPTQSGDNAGKVRERQSLPAWANPDHLGGNRRRCPTLSFDESEPITFLFNSYNSFHRFPLPKTRWAIA